VGVVELDSDLVGELLPRATGLLESADDIVERSSAPEVLLLQAKLLTAVETAVVRYKFTDPEMCSLVVRVENSRDGLGTLLISYRALIVTVVELLEVELAACSFAAPKTEVVASASLVSGNCIDQSLILLSGLDVTYLVRRKQQPGRFRRPPTRTAACLHRLAIGSPGRRTARRRQYRDAGTPTG
jgi:hypothetical protein